MKSGASPAATIIIPAYNAEKYIVETLDSIVAQDFTDWECIVVDDGSTDGTRCLVESYPDCRVHLVSQPNSGGPAKPRNVGLLNSKADIIFFFDADDIMAPNKVSATLECFHEFKQVGFVCTDFCAFSTLNSADMPHSSFVHSYLEYREITEGKQPKLGVYIFSGMSFIAAIVSGNFVGTSSVAFRRNLLPLGEKLFNENISSGDDLLAWCKLISATDVAFIDTILHRYRLRSDSISNTNFERLVSTKIYVLNLICARFRLHKGIVRAAINKSGEYYIALGYYYRKRFDYKSSCKAYYSAMRLGRVKQSIVGLVKLIGCKVSLGGNR